jgi:hypothetical protein
MILIAANAYAASLGTVEVETDIGGTKVKFPVALDLTVSTVDEEFQLNVVADMSLSNLQEKFDSIVKGFPVPKDNCPGYGQHVLPTVESAALLASGNTAVIDAKVNVVVWDCQQGVPLGGTTVRWEMRCVDLGPLGRACTHVPVKVEPRPGPDIKNILVKEGLVGKVNLSLLSPDGKSIEVRPSNPSVIPRGDIGKYFNIIAGIFNSSLSDIAQKEIRDIVDAGVLRQALPKEILAFDPQIKTVQFQATPDGKLSAKVDFQALITGDQLADWINESIEE